jgi:hypothetical protein
VSHGHWVTSFTLKCSENQIEKSNSLAKKSNVQNLHMKHINFIYDLHKLKAATMSFVIEYYSVIKINELPNYTKTWMNPEIIFLSERRQTESLYILHDFLYKTFH